MELNTIVRKLSAHLDPTGTTVTLALDLSKSGRLPAETRVFLKDQVYENLASEARSGRDREVLRKLSRRIREFVEKDVRPGTDGLFLAAGPGLWEAVELRVPLRNMIAVGRTPCVAPLIEAMRRAPRAYAVDLHNDSAFVHEVRLGERRERARLVSAAPADDRERGVAVRGGAERELHRRRLDAAMKKLAKQAAREVAVLHKDEPAEAVLVSEASAEFKAALPADLRNRLLVAPSVEAVDALSRSYDERVAGEVKAFQAARAQGLQAALGPRDVLEALASGTVERVFLDPVEPFPGVICVDCGARFPELHRRCPYCEGDVVGASMTQEILSFALAHPPTDATFVDGRTAWLKDLGGMAALLSAKGARRPRSGRGILAREG